MPKDTPITYTVTFDSNGGGALENQTVIKDARVAQPADPRKSNYIFVGWYSLFVQFFTYQRNKIDFRYF